MFQHELETAQRLHQANLVVHEQIVAISPVCLQIEGEKLIIESFETCCLRKTTQTFSAEDSLLAVSAKMSPMTQWADTLHHEQWSMPVDSKQVEYFSSLTLTTVCMHDGVLFVHILQN